MKSNTKKINSYEYHISLGSNIAPREGYLEQACELIYSEIGNITTCSKVYQTPAWGFSSAQFLNACIVVQSKYNTKKCLELLQQIEVGLGRKHKAGITYEARTIDLDILYSSEGVFNYDNLVVPHPLITQRRFVLQPLLDVAPMKKHPLFHKNTKQLLDHCEDNSVIEIFDFSLKIN